MAQNQLFRKKSGDCPKIPTFHRNPGISPNLMKFTEFYHFGVLGNPRTPVIDLEQQIEAKMIVFWDVCRLFAKLAFLAPETAFW